MQPTQVPLGLYPAPPPQSGLQRWPSESLDQCHVMSAGPPTHRQNTLKCCTLTWTSMVTVMLIFLPKRHLHSHQSQSFFLQEVVVALHILSIHYTVFTSHKRSIKITISVLTNMYRFMTQSKQNPLSLCTCRERAVLGGTLATSPCSFLFLNLRKYS